LATNVKGLADKLERIQSQLALCEKALAEYLEMHSISNLIRKDQTKFKTSIAGQV